MDAVLFGFQRVILPVEIVGGIFINILAFCVWTFGTRSKKLPCAAYFATLSLIDTLLLAFPGVILIIREIDITRLPNDTVFCKMQTFSLFFLLHCSNWIVCAISVDRSLTILFPFTFRAQDLGRRCKRTLVAIFIILTLTHIPILISIKEHPSKFIVCSINANFVNFYVTYSLIMDIVLSNILPFSIIILSNVAIATVLFKRKIQNFNPSSSSQQNIKVVAQLCLGTGLSFLLANSMLIFVRVAEFAKLTFIQSDTGLALFRIANILVYLNSFVNPMLYCIMMKATRDDIWAAIQVIARGCRRYGTHGNHDVTGAQNNAGDFEDQGTSTLTLNNIKPSL